MQTQARLPVRFILRYLLAVFLVAPLLAGCAGGGLRPTTQLKVEMDEYQFAPKVYVVPAGQMITVHMVNSGSSEHDFTILKYGVQAKAPFDSNDVQEIYWRANVDAKSEVTMQFTAPAQPGDYMVICAMSGHLEHGMIATLTVMPAVTQ